MDDEMTQRETLNTEYKFKTETDKTNDLQSRLRKLN